MAACEEPAKGRADVRRVAIIRLSYFSKRINRFAFKFFRFVTINYSSKKSITRGG